MKQIFIWGAGYGARQVIDEIDNTKTVILGIVDNDQRKQGAELFPGIPIIPPSGIAGKEFDYIIISVKKYKAVEEECGRLGIPAEKTISYWKEEDSPIFQSRAKRIETLTHEKNVFRYRLDSAPYEWGVERCPQIRSGTELLKKIMKDHSSLCRFGDGEFEMIRGKGRQPWFQKPDAVLGRRLREVLLSEKEGINIAIAQCFTGLDRYKEVSADVTREYMFGETRKFILGLVKGDRVYYDACVTRPYIMYKDKKNADEIFPLFKKIWDGRDVVLVEGEYSRTGIGNDLMTGARSISRIICPSQNAWDKYDTILNTIMKKVMKKSLVCVSLGQCATVLAYDLAKEGFQALDIGHLDNEYEWYLRGAREQVEIPGKMVAELLTEQRLEIADAGNYWNQTIAKIL